MSDVLNRPITLECLQAQIEWLEAKHARDTRMLKEDAIRHGEQIQEMRAAMQRHGILVRNEVR